MKKILLFIKLPPPTTGATTINSFIAQSKIISKNFNIKIIKASYKQKIENGRVISIKKIGIVIKLHLKLFHLLLNFKPKFVYFQLSPLGVAFLRDCTFILLIKVFRIHIVYHLHGKGIKAAAERNVLKRLLYKWAFKNCSLICLSQSLACDIDIVYKGIPYIINNGVPIAQVQVHGIKPFNKKLNVLFFSNLILSKGIIVFLNGISLLSDKYKNTITVLIIGQEAEMTEALLIREIKERNLEKCVQYLGPKYGQEKEALLNGIDILIYPTLNDAFPLVILEAMQFGICVIASKEGAITEIIDDGITGILVDKNRADQIRDAIERLIDNPELRAKISSKCQYTYCQKYTLKHFENSLSTIFHDILNNIEKC